MSIVANRFPWSQRKWLRFIPVVVVFALSLVGTYLATEAEKRRVKDALSLQFELEAEGLQGDIVLTMQSYAQALRGGVGLFHATEDVTRDEWRRYVKSKRFPEFAPGIQGMSYNAVLRGAEERDAFEALIRTTDRADFAVRPPGARDLYVPVLYLEPATEENQRAIGFDIYSEENRRAAIDAALLTGDVSMTAPITLVQNDTNDAQAGVLVVLPTFLSDRVPDTVQERRTDADGFVVSVFRIGSLIETVVTTQNSEMMNLSSIYLIDTSAVEPDVLMFHSLQTDGSGPSALNVSQTFPLYGRTWKLQTTMSNQAMAGFGGGDQWLIGWMGLAVSVLLAGLALLVVLRNTANIEAKQAAEAYSIHVQTLMQEVNHRSKNLLTLVRAIARLTLSTEPKEFHREFSKRIEGLAASQDLLVRNNWHGTSIKDLVHSQLSHFEGLIDSRIKASGPDFQLQPQAAQSIGMALHEMATNAGKYGALSNDEGQIDITWDVGPDDSGTQMLTINWVETNGPKVGLASHRGFGSAVFGSMAEHGLGAQTETRFDPEGFKWSLICPADRAREGAIPPRDMPY